VNPLRLFDYVFYTIASLYDKVFNYNQTCEEAGIGIVSIFQACNVCTIADWLNDKYSFFKERYFYLIIVYLIIIGLNIIRYKKVIRYKDLVLKWDEEKTIVKIIKIGFVIVYIFSSTILLGI